MTKEAWKHDWSNQKSKKKKTLIISVKMKILFEYVDIEQYDII